MNILQSLPALYLTLLSALTVNAQSQYGSSSQWPADNRLSQESDSTGLPGDNFSLQGALTLFKKANSPEEFERLLNTRDNNVNNLDLNNDGNIDYIRVINKKQQQVHLFILQALVSNQESQDVAIIELEKNGDNSAVIQIVGSEDIYGEAVIAEPVESDNNSNNSNYNNNYNGNYFNSNNNYYNGNNNTNYNNNYNNNYNSNYYNGNNNSNYYNGNYYNNDYYYNRSHGPSAGSEDFSGNAFHPSGVIINVWFWPCVRRVYAPSYVIWTSPWTWVNPPGWWRPWRPMPWQAYRPACYHYHQGYMYTYTRRIPPAPVMYRSYRCYSPMVMERNRVVMTSYRGARADRGGNYPPNRFNNGYYGGRNYNGYDRYRNNNGYYNGGRNSYNGYNNNDRPGNYNPRPGNYNPGGRSGNDRNQDYTPGNGNSGNTNRGSRVVRGS
ncbi:hypothetical protein [Chitinophaga tropicalis]|uniref:Uncharacterized protein n=1 Tax=Chitinophaga tropicalis TaxID=2683588 RepID=A0A7K1UBR8_9BACT|nr:hypothetical protein [Chitinophaga tropicalis]MVT11746.1 hypothetical protein [Chitinophaga tropicalis]